jgi:vacuolar-type H+-ATPase subunit E/Vma4
MQLKHIQEGLPFYAWQCLTIFIDEQKQLNLVIKNEVSMQLLLKLLLIKTKSIDGIPKSLEKWIDVLHNKNDLKKKKLSKSITKIFKSKDQA